MQILNSDETGAIAAGITPLSYPELFQYTKVAMKFFLYQVDLDPIRALQQDRVKRAICSTVPAVLTVGWLQLAKEFNTPDDNPT